MKVTVEMVENVSRASLLPQGGDLVEKADDVGRGIESLSGLHHFPGAVSNEFQTTSKTCNLCCTLHFAFIKAVPAFAI